MNAIRDRCEACSLIGQQVAYTEHIVIIGRMVCVKCNLVTVVNHQA